MLGTVERVFKRPRRGRPYGFIIGQDGEIYWFALQDESLSTGMKVSFKGRNNEKGNVAFDVKEVH